MEGDKSHGQNVKDMAGQTGALDANQSHKEHLMSTTATQWLIAMMTP